MWVLRNYNRFFIQDKYCQRWDDFYIHRFIADFKKLIKFNSLEDAEKFLDKNPEVEKDFDSWIVYTTEKEWS